MFPREARLRRHRDIQAVLRRGRSVTAPGLGLRFRPTPTGRPRVTVVVSTAVSKRATVRNRVKRQLRHLLRGDLRGFSHGVDLMLTVRPPLLKTDRQARQELLRSLLRRAGIF